MVKLTAHLHESAELRLSLLSESHTHLYESSCVCMCLQDLQESEVCQDELALRVKQLKAELVLFKGLVSNVSLLRTSCVQLAFLYLNRKEKNGLKLKECGRPRFEFLSFDCLFFINIHSY